MEIKVEETVESLKLALAEMGQAIEIYEEEAARLRNSNRICRAVIRSLRRQLNIAHLNDELMKALCSPDLIIEMEGEVIEGEVIERGVDAQGGLPCANPSQTTSVQS